MFQSTTSKIAAKIFSYFKVFGFCTVTIIDGKSITKPIDIFYLVSSISLGVFICSFSIYKRNNFASSNSEIADIGNFTTFFMSIVISIISMVISFIFRHKNWTMILKLENVERRVSKKASKAPRLSLKSFQFYKIGFAVDYEASTNVLRLMVFLVVILNFPLSLILYFLDPNFIKAIFCLYSNFYFTLNLTTACSYGFTIIRRIQSMTNVLSNLIIIPNYKGLLISFENDEKYSEIILELMNIYGELTEICQKVNLCHGFTNMLSFGLIFFHTLFTYFVIFKDFFDEGKLSYVTITSLVYSTFYNIFLTAIILCNTVKEREVRSKIFKYIFI